jgi:phosphate transport system protein
VIVTMDHTTKAFDADIQDLMRTTAEMGGYAEKQFVDAVDALIARDSVNALRVVRSDAMLDARQREIEQKAIETIATRQPMAVDLREIVAVLGIANDLERIGDLAKNIGKRVIALNGAKLPRRAIRGVMYMTNLVLGLLRDMLDSFAERDGERAVEVRNRDEDIDRMYISLSRELISYMKEDPETITFGIHLLFCVKNIERIGDHATNIAEAVYYMVEGHTLLGERPKVDSVSVIPAHPDEHLLSQIT